MSSPSQKGPPALSRLPIAPEKKSRRKAGPLMLFLLVVLVVAAIGGVFVFTTNDRGSLLLPKKTEPAPGQTVTQPPAPPKPGDVVLTVSGYIIPRERIELSPRFQAMVKWIGVRKGDLVKKDDVIVRLDDAEYRAKLLEAEGNLARAQADLANAEANLKRQQALSSRNIESERALDDARRARDVALAQITCAKGQIAQAQNYVDWCVIRAPISGTILEKLVEADELVTPMTFGGTRGPSTALVSMADLNDLQVEIDLNEADLAKIHLKQRCRISPEAYPDKRYGGYVAEIAPEANRQKGTLQIKVQVEQPDHFMTPELSAKVDFIRAAIARQ
ncbi:MAG: efflux RND transporter periplasmic adaptor subunit [Verrucomicrobia bacterium]|nr:efflux RND transporter periplasmic adaptor subunit [Verrucomicrobiota bacterium]